MGDTKLAKVADFLETMPTTCPHDLSAARMAPATPSSRPIFSPSTGSGGGKAKRRDGNGRPHFASRRHQFSAPSEASALHARERLYDNRRRDADLARRGGHCRNRDPIRPPHYSPRSRSIRATPAAHISPGTHRPHRFSSDREWRAAQFSTTSPMPGRINRCIFAPALTLLKSSPTAGTVVVSAQ
jgi:hypothetical protein